MSRVYRSKIGRLPFAVRNEICERMRDGETAAVLVAWINKLPEFRKQKSSTGCSAVNAQNITDWRATGYADWLKERERSEHLREMAEAAHHIGAVTGDDPSGVGAKILTGKLLDMLSAADEDTAADLVKSISILRNSDTDARRVDLARQKLELSEQALQLEREKFKRTTCELFIKWHSDKKALDIVDGGGTNDDKIKALLAYMDAEEAR